MIRAMLWVQFVWRRIAYNAHVHGSLLDIFDGGCWRCQAATATEDDANDQRPLSEICPEGGALLARWIETSEVLLGVRAP